MKITVCIPVHNEEKNISTVIQCVLNQRVSVEKEIYVISSGSTDETNNIVLRYCDEGYPVKLLVEPQRTGKANAINILLPLIAQSDSEICVFTDGDIYLPETSLQKIIDCFLQNDSLSVVTGHPVPNLKTNNLWEKIAQENCDIWDMVRHIQSVNSSVWTLSGYLFAVKTKDMPEGIPVNLTAEDAYLGLIMHLNNMKMGYETDALVKVKFPSNIIDYYRQKSRTRSGWMQLLNFAPDQIKELRRLQREVILLRIYRGNFFSLVCFLLDNIIWLLEKTSPQSNSNRHLWEAINSTK